MDYIRVVFNLLLLLIIIIKFIVWINWQTEQSRNRYLTWKGLISILVTALLWCGLYVSPLGLHTAKNHSQISGEIKGEFVSFKSEQPEILSGHLWKALML